MKSESQELTTDLFESRVLLIDDQTIVAEMIQHMLEGQDEICFRHVQDAKTALDVALSYQPTVVLVDLMMPLIDGFGVIRQFKRCFGNLCMPLVLLSSEELPELKARGFSEGASDYMVKWPSRLELLARVRYHSNAYVSGKQRDEAFLSLQESQRELLARTQQLHETQEALLQAQKMEVLGQLTGGVAHDFNNVLQVISGNLQLLKFEHVDDARTQQRIASAIQGVERGANLAMQLLSFARRQPLKPIVINVGTLIRGMHEMLRRSLGERTKIDAQIARGAWHVRADASQLENVILNLAINARDAMVDEGKIIIEVENFVSDGDPDGESPELAAGDYVKISVCDSGVGMTPDVMERVFEPFFTTKPIGKGTGLGLSMAYGFVKQSGGHITLHSKLGRGTTVEIYLPRTKASADSPHSVAGQSVVGGIETVLIVEDEPDVRHTTATLLASIGYKTLQAEDAQSALTLLQSGVTVDLLFTDVVMPGTLRSDELAVEAKALLPGLEVLFTSGFAKDTIVQEGRVITGFNLLSKPYSAEDLTQKIRQILSDRKIQSGVQ